MQIILILKIHIQKEIMHGKKKNWLYSQPYLNKLIWNPTTSMICKPWRFYNNGVNDNYQLIISCLHAFTKSQVPITDSYYKLNIFPKTKYFF